MPKAAGVSEGNTTGARVAAENISVIRGERLVLDSITLSVPSGGALLLTGPNGAGKSTLLRVLAGLRRPDAGRVLLDGDAELSGKIAYLGHKDAIKPGLTAAENLSFAAAMSGHDVADPMGRLGLAPLANLPARMLSAGQTRRLALARMAVSGMPVWLLDEPTLGLDTASVAAFGDMLAAHRANGGCVVAATHLPLPLPGAEELSLPGRHA